MRKLVVQSPCDAAGISGTVKFPLGLVKGHPSAAERGRHRYGNRKLVLQAARTTDTAIAALVLLGILVVGNTEQLLNGIEKFVVLRISPKNALFFASFLLLWPAIFSAHGLYEPARTRTARDETLRLLCACTAGTLAAVPFFLTSSTTFHPLAITQFWLCVVVATVATRHLLGIVLVPDAAAERNVLIVGNGPRALRLYRELTHPPTGTCTVVGFVDVDPGMLPRIGKSTLGTLDDLERLLVQQPVDEVLITLPMKSCYAEIQRVITVCERIGVEARYLADIFQHTIAKPAYDDTMAVPSVHLRVTHDDLRRVVKRGIDILASVMGLIVLSPLFLVVAVAIKATSPGPIIFTQSRYGYHRRLFRMYKFRTMVRGSESLQPSLEHLNEADGPVFKIQNDPRVTSVGRLLRRTSLDELPQLVNVLRGEMSLVGPRPLPTRDVQHFSESRLMRRFSVIPGLTCLWQISGRSNLGFDEWISLDLHYIDRWSLGLDLQILVRTIPAVIRGTGAN